MCRPWRLFAGPKCGKKYNGEELADLFFDPFIHVDDGITSYHLIFFAMLMGAMAVLFFLMSVLNPSHCHHARAHSSERSPQQPVTQPASHPANHYADGI